MLSTVIQVLNYVAVTTVVGHECPTPLQLVSILMVEAFFNLLYDDQHYWVLVQAHTPSY
jgi:hypothetical protein